MLAKAKYKNLISNFANKKTHIYIYIYIYMYQKPQNDITLLTNIKTFHSIVKVKMISCIILTTLI